MRFFDSLFGKRQKTQPPLIGNVDPICPYCSGVLDKMPGHKKKCPICGNFIYVRTRPQDKVKVLVTEENANAIDNLWRVENGTYDEYHRQQSVKAQEWERERAALTARFGTPASDSDVQWAIFNRQLIEHARSMDWGLYRNTRFEMGEFLRREGRHEAALKTYLEVCYLDANGPSNRGGLQNSPLLRKYPPFDPKLSFQAPGVAARIVRLGKQLGIGNPQMEAMFIASATLLHKSIQLLVPPTDAWTSVREALAAAQARHAS